MCEGMIRAAVGVSAADGGGEVWRGPWLRRPNGYCHLEQAERPRWGWLIWRLRDLDGAIEDEVTGSGEGDVGERSVLLTSESDGEGISSTDLHLNG